MKKVRHPLLIALTVSLAAMLGGTACTPPPPSGQTPGPGPRDGVLVHISHGSEYPQKVLMGLSMANTMAEDKDVLVYLDIKGIEVVLKDSVEIVREGFPSAQEQISTLMTKGVTIMACPSCLNAAGKTAQDLVEGVRLADKKAFFSFTAGRILTIDY